MKTPAAESVPVPDAAAQAANAGNVPPIAARWLAGSLVSVCLGLAVQFGLAGLPAEARIALLVFGGAIIAWTVLKLPDTPVAIGAALILILTGSAPAERLFNALGHPMIWLLLAAFLIAAAIKKSGMAERAALRTVARVGSVRALFHALTAVIFLTAFLVPSTSGRAALLLPAFLAIASALNNERVTRALALLFPTAILLSACASLIGAGAHLVAADFMGRLGTDVDFMRWLVLGAPFALVTTFAATEIILRLFLTREERALRPVLPAAVARDGQRPQFAIGLIVAATVFGWLTTRWHGIDVAIIALLGALAATSRSLTGVSMKEAAKSVEWNLLLFLAATLMLGESLIESGAAKALVSGILAKAASAAHVGAWAVVAIAALAALLSHIVITSRTARATVLIPVLALPLAAFGADAAALAFLVVVASGFCQTFAVSAKPVALFAKLDRPTYTDSDLLRLALWLLPIMLAALLLFSLWIWPALGLPVAVSSSGVE